MLTGRMTATWLIVITIVGILVTPMLLIWFLYVHPYLVTHPQLLLGIVDILPNAQIIDLIGGILI
jgi:hypothetical protein